MKRGNKGKYFIDGKVLTDYCRENNISLTSVYFKIYRHGLSVEQAVYDVTHNVVKKTKPKDYPPHEYIMVDLPAMIDEAISHYGIARRFFVKGQRMKASVKCRNAVYYACKLSGRSYCWIGRHFDLNHSTVMWAFKKMADYEKQYGTYLFLKYKEGKKIGRADIKFAYPIIVIEIKKMLNEGKKNGYIADILGLDIAIVESLVNKIKKESQIKKVMNYKTGKITEIYI